MVAYSGLENLESIAINHFYISWSKYKVKLRTLISKKGDCMTNKLKIHMFQHYALCRCI